MSDSWDQQTLSEFDWTKASWTPSTQDNSEKKQKAKSSGTKLKKKKEADTKKMTCVCVCVTIEIESWTQGEDIFSNVFFDKEMESALEKEKKRGESSTSSKAKEKPVTSKASSSNDEWGWDTKWAAPPKGWTFESFNETKEEEEEEEEEDTTGWKTSAFTWNSINTSSASEWTKPTLNKDDEAVAETNEWLTGLNIGDKEKKTQNWDCDQNWDWGWPWQCTKCQTINKSSYAQCIDCRTYKPSDNKTSEELSCFVCFCLYISTIPWCKSGDFKCIVAIDFGTDGTAMALSVNNSDKVYRITDWNTNGICDKNDQKDKTKTAILFDEHNRVLAFGNEAVNMFRRFIYIYYIYITYIMNSHLCIVCDTFVSNKGTQSRTPTRQEQMVIVPTVQDESLWYYGLVNENQKEKVNVKNTLQAVNKSSLSSEVVFVGALQYCKQIVNNYLTKNNLEVDEKHVQWIITVPAIWSDQSKGLMMDWAQKANLYHPSIDNQLVIAFEPECASMSILTELQHNREAHTSELKSGDCYLMLDLGAGTADMVCHEIVGPFEVRELIPPSGGPWGSSYIDTRFEQMLQQIFGCQLIDEFKITHPDVYVELLRGFEDSKRRFFARQRKVEKHSIPVPFQFDDFVTSKATQDIEVLVSNCSFNAQTQFFHLFFFFFFVCVVLFSLLFFFF
ncbi:hypothetical protein RFI_05700 [Reticulomyxa filosa]|uniref:RanBP2-type domain-containing protein n=1 Tax=Reticulomyxa filosa TaxID=46433 RepID=X6P021_RETFI|nr:hypothetical protein RFI_05700 [Reticulomyxa filosa]|eukprot:ETO31419.1 hypothetical protein RFI_05700 [Reticulomyxa filosa]